MAIQVQRRRGTTSSHATFVGALGEVTVDTTKKTLVVHDGVTPGGFPMGDSANAHIMAPANAHAASAIANTPSGALSSATVQGALDELAGGKAEIGANSSITSLSALASINGGQLAGLRNKLIGGHFDKNPWQRGTTFTVTTTGTYVADRWRVDFDGAANITVSKVALPAPQVINGVWCSYGLKFQVNSKAGNTFIRLSQRIEYVDTLTTMSTTLQTAILGSGSFTVPVNARQNFGTGGSADVVIPLSNSLAVTSSLQQLNAGFIVPTIALKTMGAANDYLAIEYDLTAVPVSGVVMITLAQFESGSVATPFEQRPYGLELMLCHRYFQKLPDFVFASTNEAANVNGRTLFGSMRTTPTMTGTPASGTGATVAANGTGGYSQAGLHSTTVGVTGVTASAEL